MSTAKRKARKSLLGVLLLILSLGGFLAYGVYAKDESWAPGLALDLAGGVEIILKPVSTTGDPITEDVLQQAVEVMRRRIDGTGVAESEITTQGTDTIMVALPGKPSDETLTLVAEAAQLQFRPVLYWEVNATATELPVYLDPEADPYSSIAADTASSYSWITEQARQDWIDVDCADDTRPVGFVGNPGTAFVACSDDPEPANRIKYLLGPVELFGDDVASSNAGPSVGTGGAATGYFEVRLDFTTGGGTTFERVTGRIAQLAAVDQFRGQFAILLDGEVISAPVPEGAISGGSARINRSQPPMLREEAVGLSNKLKYGALPLSFEFQSQNTVAATLGTDQLRAGLLAGAIGLLLVVLYSFLQYRALALVVVGSLVVAGAITLGTITALSHLIGLRLSLAGVTGLIVSIGITADSFIVYFERVRDELRDGRSLPAAVDHGWTRAKRTIIASDAVSMIAAVALYMTAVGNVRGFAFVLGLTTIVDLIVITRFTHPMLVLLSGTSFFGGGHRFSGLDPRLLGRSSAYKGRGRVEAGAPTLAERKAGLTGQGV